MTRTLHLGDPVEIVTDKFSPLGAPRGAVGVIVDDWSDGSNDVEVSDPDTGEAIARFRAAEDEIAPYLKPFTAKESREHGILFGRGAELGKDVEEPPMSEQWIGIPAYGPAPIAFKEPPKEEVEVVGDVPWELRDEPPTGPTFH